MFPQVSLFHYKCQNSITWRHGEQILWFHCRFMRPFDTKFSASPPQPLKTYPSMHMPPTLLSAELASLYHVLSRLWVIRRPWSIFSKSFIVCRAALWRQQSLLHISCENVAILRTDSYNSGEKLHFSTWLKILWTDNFNLIKS